MQYAIAVCISPNSFSALSSPSKLWSVPPDLAHLAGGDIELCLPQLHFLADGDRAHVRYYLSLARKDISILCQMWKMKCTAYILIGDRVLPDVY